MAEQISTMIAQPIVLGSSVSLKVTDSTGGPRVATLPAATYRTFLSFAHAINPGVNSGTEADPHELLNYARFVINGPWTIALSADGFVVITYVGTGTGVIQWDDAGGTSSIIRNLLGFATNLSLAPNVPTAGTYHPTHVAYSYCRAGDAGWTPEDSRVAAADLPDGSTFVLGDGRERMVRTFDLRFHPKDWATRVARGAAGSPAYPSTITKQLAPTAVPITGLGMTPWSLYETLKTPVMPGYCRLGLALGNFEALQNGSAVLFEDGYFTADHYAAKKPLRTSMPGWDALRDWAGVSLSLKAQSTR